MICTNIDALRQIGDRYIPFKNFPSTRGDTMADSSQLTEDGSKVRRFCQSTIVGGASVELCHSDRNLRTA